MRRKLKNPNSKAYTLIEVLISLAIFSTMIILAGYTFSQILDNFKKVSEKGYNIWENTKYLWMSNLFVSMTDYFVYSNVYGWYPYFVGLNDRISFVTLSPIIGDYPSVVFLIKESKNNGKYNLTVYEKRVFVEEHGDLEGYYFTNEIKKWNSMTLLDNCDQISFEYYGYQPLEKKYRWSFEYEGIKTKSLPLSVKINCYIDNKKNEISLIVKNNSLFKWYYNEVFKIK